MSALGDALRRGGCRVITDSPVPGRPPSTGGFSPAGVMLHHTASSAPDVNQIELVRRGRADLPGPLYNVYVRRDGSGVDVISQGRANHAGRGNNGRDGNALYYGIGAGHPGNAPISGPIYELTIRAAAAIAVWRGYQASAVVLHREWTSRKIDLRNNGPQCRSDVARLLSPAQPPPSPGPVQVDKDDQMILQAPSGSWWLLTGGRLASITQAAAANARAGGLPAWAVDAASWTNITATYPTAARGAAALED